MVLAEAMAAGVPILASSSGAIGEVLGGTGRLFTPGDWVGLSELLRETAEEPRGERRGDARYSTQAAAERIAAAYGAVLEQA
jgi:glycosyltransferase involved in cell wall biosynthesis